MNRLQRFLAPAGAVLLLFGLISYAVTLQFDLWTGIHIGLGLSSLAAAITLNLAAFRRTVAARGTRRRAGAFAGAVLFCGILVTANVLAARHPWRYDATENRIHTLSEKTEAVVASLDQPVEVLLFLETADQRKESLDDLLKRYAAGNDKLTYRFVDAEREPQLADQFGVRQHGVVVAKAGERTAQSAADAPGGITEGVITNLLLKVSRPGPQVVYFLTGHGEPDPADQSGAGGGGLLAAALKDQNLESKELLLSTQAGVPDDASLVIVAGPKKPLFPHEIDALRAYLGRAGRVLALIDPGPDQGLAPLLAEYRITLGDDMIVDKEDVPFLGARLGVDPLVSEFLPHPITRNFHERIVLPQARSVRVAADGGNTATKANQLAETSAAAWAEKDWQAMLQSGRVAHDTTDAAGPVPVAAAAEIEGAKAEGATPKKDASRLVVIGDSDLAVNGNLDAYFNREFLLNSVEWLAGRDELIAEGPRGYRPSRLDMTQADFRSLFRLGVLLLPEVLLVLGLGVWWRRRSL